MILILFLWLKLSILRLCVSDLGYQCITDDTRNDPEIFLIQDQNTTNFSLESYQTQLNSEFIWLCRNYYNIKFSSVKDEQKHDNVIHFAVPDYYDGKSLNNFEYAGNISKIDDAVCTKTDKAQPEFDCHEIVNLVSKSVLDIDDGHVYNFVQRMQIMQRDPRDYIITDSFEKSCEPSFRQTSDLTIVLLCLRGSDLHKEVNIQPLQLIQVPNCNFNKIRMPWDRSWNRNRLLAVLAPEPFDVPFEYSVPIIFYETPYPFSEYKTAFPNSINLVPWRLLKYGFLKFIQTVGWQRVAIVTDDSEYSLEFEDELTALFSKEQIIYTVIRCEDANCEMEKIAKELNEVSARIVIANVDEKHTQYLFQNTHNKITWLVRDMVGERHKQYLPMYNNRAFSISLSIDRYTKRCNVEDNILTGLSSIAQAYKNISEEDYKARKREFYRIFADKAKQVTPRITEATVLVRKLYSLEVISAIAVNATGAKLISYTDPFIFDKPTDGTTHCLLTSYNYHKSCEEPLVMFFMFALMLFLLTILVITCYFDKTSPYNDIRYQNF